MRVARKTCTLDVLIHISGTVSPSVVGLGGGAKIFYKDEKGGPKFFAKEKRGAIIFLVQSCLEASAPLQANK